jgi:RNA polymerase sigma-70 factor (ECF subfamily)
MSEARDEPTSFSLLQKVREPATRASEIAWSRFVKLYTPLLFLWARRMGASEQDAPDLVQEVFPVLAREMPAFQHDPGRRFRGWLWTVTLNKWRDRIRQQNAQPAACGLVSGETVASTDNVAEFAEEEYRGYLLARALDLMRAELPEDESRACQEYIIKDRPAGEVARELGMTVNQVYLAKSRFLRRVREELEGLLD